MREQEQSVFVIQKAKMPLTIRICILRKMTLKRHVFLFSKRLKSKAKTYSQDFCKVAGICLLIVGIGICQFYEFGMKICIMFYVHAKYFLSTNLYIVQEIDVS